ncbi:cation:proton antiporter domain-containing protein [Enhygromyxa salina]|uniref:PTS system fructose-specific EIIABC component n=1 Tax=Enhygromyxa salina TaxID=215803 RepID=A0A2S9YK76_9BACT|nr:cation:proton antiporter [Enhygromyxa salina]PRQ05505.1 PTS system fructose-specific EIIABC component [Enhygromyxa salina]
MDFSDPHLNLATILIAGILGGELVARFKLPKVTGWIGTGIIVRALALPGLEGPTLLRFAPFTDFVLGFIAFTVGATLHFHSLRNAERRLSFLLIGEALITPTIVFLAMYFVGGVDLRASMLLAVIAIAGAPGTTVIVVREVRARGLLSGTLIAAIGLIDMVAVGGFVLVSSLLREGIDGWDSALMTLGVEFGGSLAIGLGCALLAVGLTRRVIGPAFVGPTMVALILGAWGLAEVCDVSGILACTFAGLALSNLQHDTTRAAEAYLQPFGGVLFAGFYTLVGLRLDFSLVVPMAGLVALYFCARLIGKSTSAFAAMSAARVPPRVRNHLGLALLPHGGVAAGLLFFVQAAPRLAGVAETVVTIGLATLAINQLVGPSATRFSLARAGEIGQDRPRLLDFLEEQRIVLNMRGSKRELIQALADRLYATTPMLVPKAEFVDAVIEREDEASTCLGLGLMIPHALIPAGEDVSGVLGLSTEGLDLDAGDGRSVHAVLLLAAPESNRNRHLQILAAFASALTKDENLREQLYHARSAGHAYEILHADEADELNYFLDEAIERVARG